MEINFEHFQIAFQAVVPLFVLMGAGVVTKQMKLLTPAELVRVNRMVFHVFYSVMMFYNMVTTNIVETFRPRLIVFAVAGVALTYLASVLFTLAVEKSPKRRGAMIQALYRSNFVLIGIPLVATLFGDSEIAVTTMLIAIVVPIYNVVAVVTLESFRGGKVNVLKVLKDVFKNPMIVGALAGLLCLLAGVTFPQCVLKPLGQITAATTPVALIVLGASFRLGSTQEHLPQLVACVAGRLVIIPAVALGAAYYLGFRGVEFATLVSIFATPCAVASFAMAQQMDSDAELAGNAVVFTSALSIVTIFFWILLFKSLGAF